MKTDETRNDKAERKMFPWWPASAAAGLAAAPLVGWALGVPLPGLVLGGILAALGLRLAVMVDAVRGPEADVARPPSARRPERLRPAHV